MEQGSRVEDWPTRRFDGGYAGLHRLAGEEFSGVVRAGGARLLMAAGRVVGTPEGGIEAFDDATGTAHAAPEPSLALLFAMQDAGGETRGEYYTENTPLQEVDDTLRGGGFTGYVELSENVLSGDYYLVYHGGERSAVAFIGNARRLKTGAEAFERAADEVGIYTVTAVDVTVTEIPGDPPGGAAAATADAGDGADETTRTEDADDGASAEATTGTEDVTDPGTATPAADPTATEGTAEVDDPEPASVSGDGQPAAAGEDAAGNGETTGRAVADTGTADPADGSDDGAPEPGTAVTADVPTDTTPEDRSGADGTAVSPHDDDLTPAVHRVGGEPAVDGESAEGATAEAAGRLRKRVGELQRERDELRERLESVAAERDQLAAANADLEATAERLRARVDELEAELEALAPEEEGDRRPIPPEEALAGTNLFVRYESKSDATLEDAREGGLNHESVSVNLGLEHHTAFEAGGVSVAGEPYEVFLEASVEYTFVRWVLTELLYEIRDTDNVQEMQELYDALPEIDRAELHATVEAGGAEPAFDVVFRDRTGSLLAVADLTDSREPTTGADLEELLDGAGEAAAADTFVGAFLVTSSYFEPDAVESAEAAADTGGLLSRSKRASYVKPGGNGFHLCLVEGRDRRFHVVVPEL